MKDKIHISKNSSMDFTFAPEGTRYTFTHSRPPELGGACRILVYDTKGRGLVGEAHYTPHATSELELKVINDAPPDDKQYVLSTCMGIRNTLERGGHIKK